MTLQPPRRLKARMPLYHAGDPAQDLVKLVSGVVMVFQIFEDGRRQVLDIVTAGELVHFQIDGELDHHAEALTDIEVISIPVSELTQNRAWTEFVFDQMRDRLDRERRHVALLGQKSAAERLAEFLFLLSDRLTTPLGDIELPMSRQEIADYTGLTIETVSRLFSRWLRERRLVATGRRTYRIAGCLAA